MRCQVPAGGLISEVSVAQNTPSVHKIVAEISNWALDLSLGLRPIGPTGTYAKAPVRREAQELRIFEQLAAVKAIILDDDGLHLVEEYFAGHAAKCRKRVLQASHDGKCCLTQFALSAEERVQMLPSGKATVIRSRTGWALSYMKQAELVESPRRVWYQITTSVRGALASNPARIDNEFLTRFDGFRDFRKRSRPDDAETTGRDQPDDIVIPIVIEPPDEALDRAYARLRASVEAELLDTTRTVSPAFFERLVIDLLVRMGYGGNRVEAARAIGRTGDGGIDGVIDEDRLGLDSIYVQANAGSQQSGDRRSRNLPVRSKANAPPKAFYHYRRIHA